MRTNSESVKTLVYAHKYGDAAHLAAYAYCVSMKRVLKVVELMDHTLRQELKHRTHHNSDKKVTEKSQQTCEIVKFIQLFTNTHTHTHTQYRPLLFHIDVHACVKVLCVHMKDCVKAGVCEFILQLVETHPDVVNGQQLMALSATIVKGCEDSKYDTHTHIHTPTHIRNARYLVFKLLTTYMIQHNKTQSILSWPFKHAYNESLSHLELATPECALYCECKVHLVCVRVNDAEYQHMVGITNEVKTRSYYFICANVSL